MPDATPLPNDRAQLEILLLQEQIRDLKKEKKASFSLGAMVSLATAIVSLLTAWSAFQSERDAWKENSKSQEAAIAAKDETLTEKQTTIEDREQELVVERNERAVEVKTRQEAEAEVLMLQSQQLEMIEWIEQSQQLDAGGMEKLNGYRAELPTSIRENEIKLWERHEGEALNLRDRGVIIPEEALRDRLDRTTDLPNYSERLREGLREFERGPGPTRRGGGG